MDARDLQQLTRAAVGRFAVGALFLAVCFFVPAGTIRYWEAWVYLAVLLVPVALAGRYLLRHDPEALRRRFTMREEREAQSVIQKVGSVVWIAVFLVPGLDQRFGWSAVPLLLVVAGDVLVLGGYLFWFLVMRENSFASRTVKVESGQEVITTGPYALVRHPMYLSIVIMFGFTPLALGSFWALIPGLLTVGILVPRILDEEAMLLAELPGYREYAARTRYRLIPGVW